MDCEPSDVPIVVYSHAPIVARGIAGCLDRAREGWCVIADVWTEATLLDAVGKNRPRVVVAQDPVATHALATCCGSLGAAVLMLVNTVDATREVELVRAGVRGVGRISMSERQLLDAVTDLVEGRPFISNEALDALRIVNEAPTNFSDREQQVTELVGAGYTNDEIAQTLFLAPSTIKTYVARACRKQGVASRRDLLKFVLAERDGVAAAALMIQGQ